MSNKFIDLIAFNETRLDSSITNGMIHLNDYDIIRKDRSRNGGGVCIYLRSSINYIIRQDELLSHIADHFLLQQFIDHPMHRLNSLIILKN